MSSFINLEYLHSLVGDDEETKQTMLSLMLEELPEEIGHIRTAWKARDLKAIHNASHKLKTSLSFVGNEEMTQANLQILKIAKEGLDTSPLPDLIAVLERTLPKVLAEIKSLLNGLAG